MDINIDQIKIGYRTLKLEYDLGLNPFRSIEFKRTDSIRNIYILHAFPPSGTWV
jgi:hypothetical protein